MGRCAKNAKRCAIGFLSVLLILFVVWIFPNHKYNGIDISHYNKGLDWSSVKTDENIKFCIVKATEGESWVDGRCVDNVKNSNKIGLKTGLYHYFRTGVSGKRQFENFDKDITEYQCSSGNVYDYAVDRGYAWQKGTGADVDKIFIYENFNNSKTVTVLNSRIEEGTKITDAISKINVDIKDEAYFNDITVTAFEINGAIKKSITEGNFELNKEYLLSINVDLASNDILIDNLNHVIVNHDKQYSLYYDSSILANNTSGFTVSKTNLLIYFRFTPIERPKSSGSKKYTSNCLFIKPFSRIKSNKITDTSAEPIYKHTNPYAKNA